MDDVVADLAGCFVVEVGERQAWPFVTFCDNRPARSRELRLYIDANFEVVPEDSRPDDPNSFVRLGAISNRTVVSVSRSGPGLVMEFDGGYELRVAGEARADTVGDVWWLSDWVES